MNDRQVERLIEYLSLIDDRLKGIEEYLKKISEQQ